MVQKKKSPGRERESASESRLLKAKPTPQKNGTTAPRRILPTTRAKTKIVGIGASAGGLEAFTELLGSLPAKANAAYVLVQHLDPTHRSLLSELLGRTTALPVREILDKTRVEANQIYVIPPNCDLTIRAGILGLTPRKKNGPARSIDHFLQSLAGDQKENAIGVILSGAGSDGAKGLKAIKHAGGLTFAQDADSSKYDSMPRSAIGTGCVDFVLPPSKIAAEIARLILQPGSTKSRAAANARQRSSIPSAGGRKSLMRGATGSRWPAGPEDTNLRKLFVLLRTKTGLDFSLYRPTTISRRLNRRLALHKLTDLESYLRNLRESPAEIEALYQDLLLNVTSFFRNPSVFDALKKKIFPRLAKDHSQGDSLRFWVAGCSTGQEAYTLAMDYMEFAERAQLALPAQIFATDVNASVLEHARLGRYTKAQVSGVSAERLQRFFQKENEVYRVQKPIRDMVIFAQQNILSDPPFTRVDMITCRNMLIYFEPALQERIIPSFHYSLRAGGFLVLGASESVGQFTNLFETLEKRQKIYQKKAGSSWLRYDRPPALPMMKAVAGPTVRPVELNTSDAFREADRITLAKYAPAAVLVNETGEVLQFRGDAQKYLELPRGKASFHLLKMAREGLAVPLQRAMDRARKENRPIREKDLRYGERRATMNLEIVPLKNLSARCFLVLFEKPPAAAPAAKSTGSVRKAGKLSKDESRRVIELRRDFAETREHLTALQEEHETSVEELQASNEEVQSANEELQSLNEELETSNEELESANEELTTLNEELATRNNELRESELRLREQAELLEMAPVLARSTKDRIIFWNRGAEQLYGYSKEEAIGQTAHLFLNAQFGVPREEIDETLQRQDRWEGEILHRRKDGREICVASQWVVHRDAQGKVRAVLEVNADITARKQAERALTESEEFNRSILASTPDCIEVLDLAGRLLFMSPSGLRSKGVEDFSTVSNAYWPGTFEGEDRTMAEAAYRQALTGQTARFQVCAAGITGSQCWFDVAVQPILAADGRAERLLAIARDVTEHKRAELTAAEDARIAALRADISYEVARSGECEPLLQQITEILVRRVDAAFARIWIFRPETSMLELRASAGMYTHLNGAHARIGLGEYKIGRIGANKKPHSTNDVLSDQEISDPKWVKREGMVAFAGYPLLFQDRLLGVVALFAKHALEPRILHELGLTAGVVAQFIERKNNEDERARLLQQATSARNEAVAASRAKDDFLAALSHELRTPLNPVLLLASEGASDASLPDAVRATFRTICNNVNLEARLIDDLLDLTRIARGKLALEMRPTDIHAVLREAIGIVSSEIEEKGISLELKLRAQRVTVIGDTVRLQQVFWNVLKNAAKFTPRGGRIALDTIVCGPTEKLKVHITDSGVGLADGDRERIFDAFSQGEHRKGGLGLGLAITRRLLENLGGSITATSPGLGKGSTFEIELPLAGQLSRQAEPGRDGKDGHDGGTGRDGHALLELRHVKLQERVAPPPDSVARRKILLIEDHSATRTALQALLRRRKFEVVTASCAAEARERASAAKPDIVISDLGLPDGDGCTLFGELRAAQPNLIGVALSGYGMDDDVARSLAAGFATHLTKPIDMNALARAIAAISPEGDSGNK